MNLDRGVLKSLPKVLLHEHLDGVLRPKTVIELASSAKYGQLPAKDPEDLARWFHQGSKPGKPAKISGRICAHHRRDANRGGARASSL